MDTSALLAVMLELEVLRTCMRFTMSWADLIFDACSSKKVSCLARLIKRSGPDIGFPIDTIMERLPRDTSVVRLESSNELIPNCPSSLFPIVHREPSDLTNAECAPGDADNVFIAFAASIDTESDLNPILGNNLLVDFC
jgi:hypothetical protein